jgi:hypothetical protein
MLQFSALNAAILGLSLYLVYSLWRKKAPDLPLPPGPSKLPLVGNLFDIPSKHPWKTYMAWSRKYSRYSTFVLDELIGEPPLRL